MRVLRTTLVAGAGWLAGFAPAFAGALGADYTPAYILENFHPTQPGVQRGVDYDDPTEPAAIAACKVEKVQVKDKNIGYALRDAQGQLLRRFVDADGKPGLDQWSYYLHGFEVYREVDLNGDRSLDECRWLNSGGTRIAEIKGGKIASWKRISAEEASKVFVQALVANDFALAETVDGLARGPQGRRRAEGSDREGRQGRRRPPGAVRGAAQGAGRLGEGHNLDPL